MLCFDLASWIQGPLLSVANYLRKPLSFTLMFTRVTVNVMQQERRLGGQHAGVNPGPLCHMPLVQGHILVNLVSTVVYIAGPCLATTNLHPCLPHLPCKHLHRAYSGESDPNRVYGLFYGYVLLGLKLVV